MVDIMIDELLCYISWKLQVMTTDDLVNICVNSFTETKISESKLSLFNACERGPGVEPQGSGIKYKRRQGDNCAKNSVKDIITLLQELGCNAPKFAAADLNSIPCPRTESIDLPSLLKSISDLRTDVSALTKVVSSQQETITALLKTLADKSSPPTNASMTAAWCQPRYSASARENGSTQW